MMTIGVPRALFLSAFCIAALTVEPAHANDFREQGKVVKVAASSMTVTPPRDWNRLGAKPGKYAEIWTLDGEQLNNVTFYGGIQAGMPLLKERDKKKDPLPKLAASTLIIEVPELLEGTYRAHKQIGAFVLTGSNPVQFLGHEGVMFTYEYTDDNELTRAGEARAVLINKKLYMATFDAPRLHFFAKTLDDFRALADTAKLSK